MALCSDDVDVRVFAYTLHYDCNYNPFYGYVIPYLAQNNSVYLQIDTMDTKIMKVMFALCSQRITLSCAKTCHGRWSHRPSSASTGHRSAFCWIIETTRALKLSSIGTFL